MDDKLLPRKAWVVPIASPHSPALWRSNAYLNVNIGVGRSPGRRLRVRHVLSRRRSLGLSCLCYLFVELTIYLFIGAWGEKLSFAVIRCAPVDANKLARATVRDDHRRRVCSSTKTLMARIAATSAIMSHRRNVRSCLRSCDARCK